MTTTLSGTQQADPAADPAVDPAVDPARPPWRDPKRHLWPLGVALPLLPLVAWGLVSATGVPAFWWFGPVFVFGLLPLLDAVIGSDALNPPEDAVSALDADRYYRRLTYAFIPMQYAGLAVTCWLWSRGGLSVVDKVGLAFTVGCVAGIAINTAHELGHKRDDLERRLAKVALAQTAYGHFYLEHDRGHHVRVATAEDPASSRLGESFWAFLPRTVVGGLRSAWSIESGRWRKAGSSRWTWRNDVLNAWTMSVLLFGVLVAAFGPGILPYLAVQAVFGFSLLEVVNYLEHYGLLRQRTAAGRYERTRPAHSWNSNNTASNVLLYHLQRHSDHHANPLRRYQTLRHMDEAPQLPTGYSGMMLMAVLPPVWRRVMDPRLLAHYGGDVTRANIAPRRRERILRRYGTGDNRVQDQPAA